MGKEALPQCWNHRLARARCISEAAQVVSDLVNFAELFAAPPADRRMSVDNSRLSDRHCRRAGPATLQRRPIASGRTAETRHSDGHLGRRNRREYHVFCVPVRGSKSGGRNGQRTGKARDTGRSLPFQTIQLLFLDWQVGRLTRQRNSGRSHTAVGAGRVPTDTEFRIRLTTSQPTKDAMTFQTSSSVAEGFPQ